MAKVRVVTDGVREMQLGCEPWSDALAEWFVTEACDGLMLCCPDSPYLDISFVTALEGLEHLRILTPVADLSPVFDLGQLRGLTLARTTKDVSGLARLAGLQVLETPHARGLDEVAALRHLSQLFVYAWPGGGFSALGNQPALQFLRVQMKRGATMASAGLAGAGNLQRLWLYEGTLADTRDLAKLGRLQELALRTTKVGQLDFVRDLPNLTRLELENAGEIETLAPLRGHPSLEFVAIPGTTHIVDGDLTPLLDIPRLRTVGIDRGAPHYSHTPAEIRKRVNRP